jgi:hypothetical protein
VGAQSRASRAPCDPRGKVAIHAALARFAGKSLVESEIPLSSAIRSNAACRHSGMCPASFHESTVVTGQLVYLAISAEPPSEPMISETDMAEVITENRNYCNSRFPDCVIYALGPLGQPRAVLNTEQLLARLRDKGIRNGDIAKTLSINPSRVTEIMKGDRRVLLDEAVKLVQAFELEPETKATPLPASMIRLIVLYVGTVLGAPQERIQARLEELTAALRAFSEFVSDPKVRRSSESAEGFFQALLLARPTAGSEAPPGSDPELAN